MVSRIVLVILATALPAESALAAMASPEVVGRYAAPEGAPFTTEEVRIQTLEGHVLAGTLSMPRSSLPLKRRTPVPMVVLISGVGSQDRDLSNGARRPFHEIADTLACRGIGVLRLDDRGAGASTGSLDSTDTVDRAGDMRAAVEFLRRRPGVAKDRIGLLGHDEGGIIAPMLASTDAGIRAIVLLGAPGRAGRDLLRRQQGMKSAADAVADSGSTPPLRAWEQQARDERWLRFFADYDPIPSARQVHAPVLILAGARDEAIPAEDSELLAAAFRAAGNRDVTRIEWRAADHELFEPAEPGPKGAVVADPARLSRRLLGTIADWAVARLKPAPILARP